MNYRHAFHAGGIADVFKHLVLTALLQRCKQKPSPFFVLDTHAGTGLYDLAGVEALKTREFESGIGRLWQAPASSPLLADYLALIKQFNPDGALRIYPGSPAIIASALRLRDRAIACELHPDDHATLKRAMRGRGPVAVHGRDGYEAMGAFLPPPEKRGLILVDPPFEVTDEFTRLVTATRKATGKFPSGLYALWYPVKERAAIWRFHQEMIDAGMPPMTAVEFMTTAETNAFALNGSGVLLINPPYRLVDELTPALAELQALIAPEGRYGIIALTSGIKS